MIRRIFFSIMFVLCAVQVSFSQREYAQHSQLSNGKWVKVSVEKSGVHKLSFSSLRSMGFSNPENIRVYGYGGAVLSEVLNDNYIDDLPEVPLYDGGDFFLFYAQGPVAWTKSTHSSYSGFFVYSENPYSDRGYYFITEKDGKGARINQAERCEELPVIDITSSIDRQVRRFNEVNFGQSGRAWYGGQMSVDQKKTYSFNFDNVIEDANANVNLVVASTSGSGGSMNISINGSTSNSTFSEAKGHTWASAVSLNKNIKPSADGVFNVEFLFNSSLSSARAYIDYIAINAECKLYMNGDEYGFRNPTAMLSAAKYFVENAGAETLVWDVSDLTDVKSMPTEMENGKLTFVQNKDKCAEFVAVNPKGNFSTPAVVGSVSNQDLHSLSDIDYVILTHNDFLKQAKELAELHEQLDGMTVTVVTNEMVYNEFSSGTPDATAIRAFMKMLYDRADGDVGAPKYLLLFGDGSYDNKGISSTSSNKVNNYVLTYQSQRSEDESSSFCGDDFFSHIDVSTTYVPESAKCMFGVGRLPVSSVEQAQNVVDKIRLYMNDTYAGDWKNKICFLVDDNEGDSSKDGFHLFVRYCENISSKIKSKDNSFDVKKIYYDNYLRMSGASGFRYPDVTNLAQENIENGVMLLNYIGHSNTTGWSEERTLTQNSISGLFNKKQGFWFSASCNFCQFDANAESVGETAVLNKEGGAIGVISSTRVVYAYNNDRLNTAFIDAYLNKGNRIGDVLKDAKNTIGRDQNKLRFVLLGDPALSFLRPDYSVLIDSVMQEIDGVLVRVDTVGALSRVHVNGKIADDNGDKVADFTGSMRVVVYDKEQTLKTKGNIYPNNDVYKYPFKDRTNILYSGNVEVKDGRFSFGFIVPKDINYKYGSGRIYCYAVDDDKDKEAKGFSEDLIIGGSCEDFIMEEDGPEVALYINTESFVDGSSVNESPTFFARVSDENGINSSGCGIGHDITLSLNGGDPVVLNSRFVYDLGSFTSGSVSHKFSDLEDGEYELTFKVWDLLNNSTTKKVSFRVSRGCPVKFGSLSAVPNPAKESVNLLVTYDRPDELINYKVRVYDVDGRMVKELQGRDRQADAKMSVTWDLTDASGNRVKQGVYVAKVLLRSEKSEFIGKSEKIIVLPQ